MPNDAPMKRMQFYIPPQLHEELTQIAKQRGVPLATLIREAIEGLVRQHGESAMRDSVLDIIGLAQSTDGPRDVAEHHDAYIYRRDWGG